MSASSDPPVPIEIFLPSLLHQAAGGRSTVAVEASTFRGAIDTLLAEHPRIRPHLFDDTGTLREHVNIFFNDRNSRWLESWDQPVRERESITILQAVSGG